MSQPRLDLLREALPYIQRFKGKTFVVKISGKLTEDQENLRSLCEELALMHPVGIRLRVVQGGGRRWGGWGVSPRGGGRLGVGRGGGRQLTDLAEQLGVEQTIINGRRVTDDATL